MLNMFYRLTYSLKEDIRHSLWKEEPKVARRLLRLVENGGDCCSARPSEDFPWQFNLNVPLLATACVSRTPRMKLHPDIWYWVFV